jgi:hypothetical protein
LLHGGLFLGIFLNTEDGGDRFLRNVVLHKVTFQKREMFIATVVRI